MTFVGSRSDWFSKLTVRGFPKKYADFLEDPDEHGKVGFLLYAVTAPQVRGLNLSADMITESKNHMRRLGLDYVIAFGRITTHMALSEDYGQACEEMNRFLKIARPDGLNEDHAVRFHQRAGAQIAAGIPYSTGSEHGFLALYKL